MMNVLASTNFEISAEEIIKLLIIVVPVVVYALKLNTSIAVMREILKRHDKLHDEHARHIERLYKRTAAPLAEG